MGFPRPRGDGPGNPRLEKAKQSVSPPTRGWTPVAAPAGPDARGFPAHAGMDRRPAPASRPGSGFPRPRGDGPVKSYLPSSDAAVSPPTRGWTSGSRRRSDVRTGFPAHAGMDRSAGGCTTTPTRFPRPRGDGPHGRRRSPVRMPVSPPTRGWTPCRQRFLPHSRGFPAHAGMDPGSTICATARTGFPRPRGDGPLPSDYFTTLPVVSPPTRGWTPGMGRSRWIRDGFPAHAGMDPSTRTAGTPPGWFPRPRGDGPLREATRQDNSRVSPPTRGWTVEGLTSAKEPGGFPAHAGMDPRIGVAAACTTRFPRPRGDGPSCRTRFGPSVAVSPPTRGWTCRPRRR